MRSDSIWKGSNNNRGNQMNETESIIDRMLHLIFVFMYSFLRLKHRVHFLILWRQMKWRPFIIRELTDFRVFELCRLNPPITSIYHHTVDMCRIFMTLHVSNDNLANREKSRYSKTKINQKLFGFLLLSRNLCRTKFQMYTSGEQKKKLPRVFLDKHSNLIQLENYEKPQIAVKKTVDIIVLIKPLISCSVRLVRRKIPSKNSKIPPNVAEKFIIV